MSEKQETYNELSEIILSQLLDLSLPLGGNGEYQQGLRRAYDRAKYLFDKYEQENNLEPTPAKKAWINRPRD